MNTKLTLQLAKKLEDVGFEITNKESDVLWFGQIEYKGPRNFRNENKDTYELRDIGMVNFIAEVWPNGIGDGKQPDPALTYTINYYVMGNVRRYRCHEFQPDEVFKFYGYSRDLDEVFNEFINHLITH